MFYNLEAETKFDIKFWGHKSNYIKNTLHQKNGYAQSWKTVYKYFKLKSQGEGIFFENMMWQISKKRSDNLALFYQLNTRIYSCVVFLSEAQTTQMNNKKRERKKENEKRWTQEKVCSHIYNKINASENHNETLCLMGLGLNTNSYPWALGFSGFCKT